MSNIYLKLAALNLASPDDEVELSATTILTFKCPNPAIHSFTPQNLLQALRTTRAVAKRGPGCKIDVDVESDGVVVDEELAGILKESLGLVISQAPWWSQLPICPVLQGLPEFFLNERRPFSITIADTLPDFQVEDSQHVSTSSQDVKIPAGVPVLQIQCIALKFQFRRLLDTIDGDAKDTSSDPMDMSFEGILDVHEPYDNDPLLNEPDYNELNTSAEARQPIQVTEMGLSDAFGYEDSYLFEDGEAMLDHSFADNFSRFESQESGQTDLTTPDEGPTDGSCLQTRTTEAVTSLLTNVAMRTLIGGEQTKPTEGVQLLRPLPRHTLAVLMPLLFSPNFSSTMHQRSRFLPTITSSIASLGMAAQSPSLNSKLAELKSKSHNNSASPSLAGAVQSHAYRVMHNSLFSAKAARSLRVQADEGDDKDYKEEDSMIIDGSAVTLDRRKSPTKAATGDIFDLDFEDMLEEDEPLSEDEIDMLLDLEIMRQGHLPSCSILLSDLGGREHVLRAESTIDLAVGNIEDEIKEPENDLMMENLEKSFVAEDMEQHLLADTALMLF